MSVTPSEGRQTEIPRSPLEPPRENSERLRPLGTAERPESRQNVPRAFGRLPTRPRPSQSLQWAIRALPAANRPIHHPPPTASGRRAVSFCAGRRGLGPVFPCVSPSSLECTNVQLVVNSNRKATYKTVSTVSTCLPFSLLIDIGPIDEENKYKLPVWFSFFFFLFIITPIGLKVRNGEAREGGGDSGT